MIFNVGDEVNADDGVIQLKNAIITKAGGGGWYFIGEDIFIAKELTLVKGVMSRARAETKDIINTMMKG